MEISGIVSRIFGIRFSMEEKSFVKTHFTVLVGSFTRFGRFGNDERRKNVNTEIIILFTQNHLDECNCVADKRAFGWSENSRFP